MIWLTALLKQKKSFGIMFWVVVSGTINLIQTYKVYPNLLSSLEIFSEVQVNDSSMTRPSSQNVHLFSYLISMLEAVTICPAD